MKNLFTKSSVLAGVGVAVLVAGCLGSDDDSDDYSFRSEAPNRYLRVDRMGEPATATALLSSKVNDPIPVDGNGTPVNPGSSNRFNNFNDQRDALNRGDPMNDARDFAYMFTVGPQVNSLASLHYKLGPQMRSLGLTPCSTETATPPAGIQHVDISTCVAQAAPVVLPDVLTYDSGSAAGWPNGRGFDDPVIDRLLSAALLKISGANAPHNLNTLVGVINTTMDETGVPSPATFPHMRAAQP